METLGIDKTFYFKPINGRKSFGSKCHVNQYTSSDGVTYSDLISYGKRVAYYNHNEKFISVLGWFSNTTAIHVNTFLDFFGFDPMTKEEMKLQKERSKP
jgi:hypothetical protein